MGCPMTLKFICIFLHCIFCSLNLYSPLSQRKPKLNDKRKRTYSTSLPKSFTPPPLARRGVLPRSMPRGIHLGVGGVFHVLDWIGAMPVPQNPVPPPPKKNRTARSATRLCFAWCWVHRRPSVGFQVWAPRSKMPLQAWGVVCSTALCVWPVLGFSGNGTCDCQANYWGPACGNECPLLGTQYGVCNSHGTCDDGYAGTGACRCEAEYRGTYCETVCPGPAGNACNGHGTCDAAGLCQCDATWWGVDCINRCPAPDQVRLW